jgi:hypothetical protein
MATKLYRVVETAWRANGRETVAVLSGWQSEREARKTLKAIKDKNPNKVLSLEKQ